MIAWGVEVALDGELGSVAVASQRDNGWRVELSVYRRAADLPGILGGLYDETPDVAGVFCDPMPCAGILEALRERVWLTTLQAVEVAAASAQFRAAVKSRDVDAAPHPALEQALTFAAQRPLAASFGFERRNVPVDMSPLSAVSFALWGLRRYESLADPAVAVI